jgi:hypothetical protein
MTNDTPSAIGSQIAVGCAHFNNLFIKTNRATQR